MAPPKRIQRLWERYWNDPTEKVRLKLVELYLPFSCKILDEDYEIHYEHHLRQDILNRIRLRLYRTIPTYDPDEAEDPTAYMRQAIHWEISDALSGLPDWDSPAWAVSYDALVAAYHDEDAPVTLHPEPGYDEQTTAEVYGEELLEQIAEIVGDKNAYIIREHVIEERSFAEIARELKRHRSSVKRAFDRSQKKLAEQWDLPWSA